MLPGVEKVSENNHNSNSKSQGTGKEAPKHKTAAQ
jgi:hypothetical protein